MSGELDTRGWAWFSLVPDVFDTICKGTAYNAQDLTFCPPDSPAALPYITRTDANNGVRGYVEHEASFDVESGNAITIGDTTATIYYQEDDFICGDHIVVLRSPRLNRLRAMFIVSILNRERFRYSYGRGFIVKNISETKIKLPATLEGSPDWQFMEVFVKETIVPKLTAMAKAVWKGQGCKGRLLDVKISLHDRPWQWFSLVPDIFSYSKGKRLTKADSVEGEAPLVTAGESNQGVSRLVDNDMETFSNCLTIDMFGYCAYRGYEFCCDDNILVLMPKEEVPCCALLFVATVINQDRYKCAYGRQYRQKTLVKHKVKLPATPEGAPDWQFMEDYMKSLPYSGSLGLRT